MAFYSGRGIDIPFSASGDLSSYQYHFVRCASTSWMVDVAVGACHPVAIGVLQNDPLSGQEAAVRIAGITKIQCDAGGAITYGQVLTSASCGRAEVATGCAIMGLALEADSSGCGLISMYLWPVNTILVSDH